MRIMGKRNEAMREAVDGRKAILVRESEIMTLLGIHMLDRGKATPEEMEYIGRQIEYLKSMLPADLVAAVERYVRERGPE
jgi:hypothetical protein